MEVLSKIRTTSRTTEVSATANRILTVFEQSGLNNDAYLYGVMDLVKAENNKLITAIKRSKAESILDEKDASRDGKIRAINFIILGFAHSPDAVINGAAQRIKKIFDNYGMEIIKESYSVESSLIESLLKDFSEPGLKADLDALPGLNQVIAELAGAQAEFEAAKLAYEEEKSIEVDTESASEVKKKVVTLINNNLVPYLQGICLADEQTYGKFAGTVGQLIEDNNATIKRRLNKPEPVENPQENIQ